MSLKQAKKKLSSQKLKQMKVPSQLKGDLDNKNDHFKVDCSSLNTEELAEVEIDTAAQREKIISLSEAKLRRGEGNLVLWLRNQFGILSEPMLEREDGFKGVRHFPKIVGDIGNRKTNLTKLEYLLALDNRTPPKPPLLPQ